VAQRAILNEPRFAALLLLVQRGPGCSALSSASSRLIAAGFLRGWVESGLIVSAQLPSLE